MSRLAFFKLLLLQLFLVGLNKTHLVYSSNNHVSYHLPKQTENKFGINEIQNSIKIYMLFHKVNVKSKFGCNSINIPAFEIEEADEFSVCKKPYKLYPKNNIEFIGKYIYCKYYNSSFYQFNNPYHQSQEYLYLNYQVFRI